MLALYRRIRHKVRLFWFTMTAERPSFAAVMMVWLIFAMFVMCILRPILIKYLG